MCDDPFWVYLGDNVLKGGSKAMLEDFLVNSYDAEDLLCHVPNPQLFGVAELDERGNIVSLVEKPKGPKSDLALAGSICFLQKSIFPIIRELKPSWRNELEITEALANLLAQGRRVKAHIVTGWWKDTGKPEDFLEANRLLLDDIERHIEGVIEAGARVEGRVRIEAGTVVKAGSVIPGPTAIGKHSFGGRTDASARTRRSGTAVGSSTRRLKRRLSSATASLRLQTRSSTASSVGTRQSGPGTTAS
jgi:glucose-1-phosphate thymidylyltransferase